MQGRSGIVGRPLLKYRSPSSLKVRLMWGLFAILVASSLLLAQEGLAGEGEKEVIVEAIKYRVKGYIYQRQGKLDEAIKFYKKAIKYNPFYACAYNDLGIVYEQKGMLDRAEEHYLKALEIDPDYIVVYTNLALLYERTGELEKACQNWKKRATLGSPSDRWTLKAKERFTHLSLGLAEEKKLKRLAEKEKELAKQIKKVAKEVKEPEVPVKELAPEELQKEAALKLADEIAAAKKLEKRQRLTDVDKIYRMGLRLYRRGKYEESVEQFQEVLDLLPEHKEAKRYLGKALDSIDAQRKKRQDQIALHYDKGQDYYKDKKFELALKEFLKVKELQSDYPDIDRLIQEVQDAKAPYPIQRERQEIERRQEMELARFLEKQEKLEAQIELLLRSAQNYRSRGRFDLALKKFKDVKKLDPNYPDIDRLIQETQDAQEEALAQAETRRQRDKLQREDEGRQRQQEKLQKKIGYYFRKGEDYFANKKYDLALKYYQKIKQLDPKYPNIDTLIREVREAELKAESEKGQEKIQRERRKVRKKLEGWFEKGEKYYFQGKYDLALKKFKDVKEFDPNYPQIEARIQETQQAIARFRPEVRVERPSIDREIERDVERHFKRGESYYLAGEYQKAVHELEQVLELDPSHYDANRLLRYCRRRLRPREFRPLVRPEPETLPVPPPQLEVAKPRVKPSEIPTAFPEFLPERPKVSTTDLKEDYDILGVVAHRAKKGEVEEVNVELEKKAKVLGGDCVIQARYFEYEDYLYGYGTAVKLKR